MSDSELKTGYLYIIASTAWSSCRGVDNFLELEGLIHNLLIIHTRACFQCMKVHAVVHMAMATSIG